MKIQIHPHARQRMVERGASIVEIRQTVLAGNRSPAKFGRTRFVKVFPFSSSWNGKRYSKKRIEAFTAKISDGWIVVTVIVKYF